MGRAVEVSKPVVFVSYAWDDGVQLAARLALLLSDHGCSVWIDQFCMPRRISRSYAQAPGPKLESFLREAISSSAGFVAIRTRSWEKDEGWCEKELGWAKRCDVPLWGLESWFDGCSESNHAIGERDFGRLRRMADTIASSVCR